MGTLIDNLTNFCPRVAAWHAHTHTHTHTHPHAARTAATVHCNAKRALQSLHRAAIGLNRALAWAMIAVPVVGLLLGWSWLASLPWVIGLIAAHGLLSLALFGGPKLQNPQAPARSSSWRTLRAWLLGFAPFDASARERLLIGSWAIVLCIAWPLVLGTLAVLAFEFEGWPVWPRIITGSLIGIAYLMILGFSLRYPFAVGAHVARASDYALRRWGFRKAAEQGRGAWIAAVYVLAQFIHFFALL